MARIGYLQITRACVQSCRFCSNPPSGVELEEAGVREEIDRLASVGCDSVILTGGEPTLSPLLLPAIRHAVSAGLAPRIVTNGQILPDGDLFARCASAGLRHAHFSIHSHRPDVHDFVARNPGAWERLLRAIDLAPRLGVTADLNTVICRWNAGHLDGMVRWAGERLPFVRHWVVNGLDPDGERAASSPECVPRLRDFEPSLDRAIEHLLAAGRSFRVERVPLCAMRRTPWASTETRKIVKESERAIRFLDERGFVRQREFLHGKGDACDACRWDPICAGLYSMARHYDERELSPVFEDVEPVIRAVLGREPDPAHRARLAARRGLRSRTEQPSPEVREAARRRPLAGQVDSGGRTGEALP